MLASDPARALELVAPVVAGDLVCGDEPRACLSIDAELRLDRGDVDGAVTSFRRALAPRPGRPGCVGLGRGVPAGARAAGQHRPRRRPPAAPAVVARRAAHPAPADVVRGDRGVRARRATAAGLAPHDVGGRPTGEVTADLHRTGHRHRRGLRRALRLHGHLDDPGGRARHLPRAERAHAAADPTARAGAGHRPRRRGGATLDRRARTGPGGARRPAVGRRRPRAADPGVAARPRRHPSGGDARAVGGRLPARPHLRAGRRRPRAAPRPARRGPGGGPPRRRRRGRRPRRGRDRPARRRRGHPPGGRRGGPGTAPATAPSGSRPVGTTRTPAASGGGSPGSGGPTTPRPTWCGPPRPTSGPA